jgi:hypothetical protein
MNETIKIMISQFCGTINKLTAMTGATNLSYSNTKDEFYFKFKMCKTANYCRLQYDAGLDLYNMEFNKLWGTNFKQVKLYEGLYGDQLREVFESFTGLYLKLF